MRMILWEMRKIFRPRLLMAAVLASAMFYYMYSFKNISIMFTTTDYLIALEMTERFGPTLDDAEFEEIDNWLIDLYRQADEIVRTDPDIAPLRFSTYQALREARDELDETLYLNALKEGQEEYKPSDYPELKPLDDAVWKIMNTSMNPEQHSSLGLGMCIQEIEQQVRPFYIDRVLDKPNGAANNGIMFNNTWGELRGFISFGLPVIVLFVIVLLAPILIRDRVARMDALQVAAKRGRRIYMSQFWAMWLTSFLAVTFVLAVCALSLFAGTGLWEMRNNPVNSFMNWFMHIGTTQTLGQYLMSVLGYAYALGLGTSAVLFCLSGTSRSFSVMAATAIPLFLLAGIFFGTVLTWERESIGIKPAVVLIAGLAMAMVFLWGRRKAEL